MEKTRISHYELAKKINIDIRSGKKKSIKVLENLKTELGISELTLKLIKRDLAQRINQVTINKYFGKKFTNKCNSSAHSLWLHVVDYLDPIKSNKDIID